MIYTTSQAAEALHISPHTLRWYDRQGLLPNLKRDRNGNRIFDEKDLEFIYIVVCLKKTGMTIPDIRKYIELAGEGDASLEERYQLMLEQQKKIQEEIKKQQAYEACIAAKVNYYKKALAAGSESACKEFSLEIPLFSIVSEEEESK